MAIKSTDIAIVGMAGLFPKANDLDTLWSNMVNGVSAFAPAGKNRWRIDPDAMVSAAPCPDKAYSTSAALLNDVAFNFQGLNIDEELIRSLDPLYQVVLHTGRKAFHSCETTATDRARVGTILAAIALPTDGASRLADKIMGGSFESRLFPDPSKDPGDALIGRREALSGRVTALPAAILAKALGLGGGSFTLDAACASSLVALKLACDELTSLRKDAMLVGGVSRPDCLYTQVGFSQLQALSKSGICAPFDKKADGLVVGEGAGIFVLKRLDDALRDNDTIHALIKGIGLSNDMGGSLLSPASEGQVRALRSAYRLAGWRPSDVNYIECHGAGTPIGDLTEIKSLVDLWGDDGWNEGQCAIGSVKSMVGHMLTAAGAAGVIKTLLGMHNRTIPPTLNFEAPPPNNPLPESPFRVPAAPERWEPVRTGAPLRAGVNAFGFGGINAHLLLEEYRSDPPGSGKSPADSGNHTTPSAKKESAAFVRVSGNRNQAPIAIVGMDACFGGLNSLRAFQEAVFNGSAALCERPPKRWRGTEKVVRLQLGTNDLPGAYMDAFDWDPGMFNIPPHDIPDIIPQHLLALKTAAGAMRDAGLPLREKRENAGVVIGTGFDFEATDFHLRWMLTEKIRTWNSAHRLNLSAADMRAWLDRLQNALGPPLTSNRTQGALTGIIASRVAKAFLFGGPSLVVSAEEASGWIAIDLAVKALRQNELDTVLVGAVDMAGDVRQLLLNDVDTYSRQHIVRPFDRQADGTLPGEGAAAVVLQRLDRARRDGRRVYAVIRGTGCATGGGIDTAMEPGVYIRSLERCFDDAGAAPESIQMMETHGSGIIAEDSLEAEALNIYFADRLHNCAVGSAKAVVGHTGAASSLASVVKTALCIYHRLTPPLTNFTQPAKNIWNTDAFHLPQQPHPWLGNRVEGPVQACVAAMTGDGLCAHLLMASDEEDRKPLARTSDRAAVERLRPLGVRDFGLFTVEADTPHELLSGLDDLRRHIRKHTAADARLEKAAYRWYRQKGLDRRKKLAVSVLMRPSDDRERLLDIARHQIASGNGETAGRHTRVSYAARPLGTAGKLAVVFPGSGNHYLGMGCDVAVQWPEIIRQMDNDTDRLQSQFAPWAFVPFRTSWHAGWQKEALQQVLSDPLHTIFGQVMHGSVMFDLVKRFGIDPEAIIGYSLGESAGLFASRAWKDRERMLSRMLRSPLFKHELSGPCSSLRQAWQIPAGERFTWKVAVVNVPADKAAEIVKSHPHTRLLIVNTPAECVIGGDADQLAEVIDTLACDAVFLDGVVTVHCDAALPVAEQYRALHALPTSAPPGVSYYSCAWAQAYALSREKAADSILAQAVQGFDFTKTIRQAYADGVRVFLEVGPYFSCTRMIGSILKNRPHVAVSAGDRSRDEVFAFLKCLMRLTAERVPVDLTPLYGDEAYPAETIAWLNSDRVQPAGRLMKVYTGREAPAPVLMKREKPLPDPPGQEKEMLDAAGRDVLDAFNAVVQQTADAHERFLSLADDISRSYAQALELQAKLLEAGLTHPEPDDANLSQTAPGVSATGKRPADALPGSLRKGLKKAAFSREDCMEFAVGSVAKVLGPEFAVVDTYPVRVRLPDDPLMLVDRILSIEGEKGSLRHGNIVTEHDVLPGAWYLDGNRAPVCISVEAGQADLFLSSYLGIDHVVKGSRAYRLLDATVTFHRGLPCPGDTIQYRIEIEKFLRQGETYLFFFNFKGTIGEELLISMQNGCAGFFTEAEVSGSGGIVDAPRERADDRIGNGCPCDHLVPVSREHYPDERLEALRRGDLSACFGDGFHDVDIAEGLRLPGGRMRLIDRVLLLDPRGGRFENGLIRAEADIHPDDWFLTCHFVDDMVMPGTLMYECCAHTLRIFLQRIGWVTDNRNARYEPVMNIESVLKCRGPVTPKTRHVIYEIEIKQLGYGPEPFAVADANMYADGRKIVYFQDIGMRLSNTNRGEIERFWQQARGAAAREDVAVLTAEPLKTAPPFTRQMLEAFASGSPADVFGAPYRPFDRGRFIARLPRPPYLLMDRVIAVEPSPWLLEPDGWVTSEVDVDPLAWYFRANRIPMLPYCILNEIALQPCGWLAAYMGSALKSEKGLHFRNLDGKATLLRDLPPESCTLTVRSRLTRFSEVSDMLIEAFEFEVLRGNEPVYHGETNFGFFTKKALAAQVGIRSRDLPPDYPWVPDGQAGVGAETLEDHPPLTPDDERYPAPLHRAMPAKALRMIDRIEDYRPRGGPHGLGYIRAVKTVDPGEWFFRAHFFQDPVCPGSLGLESLFQLLKYMAIDQWTDSDRGNWSLAGNGAHAWTYRGQVLPANSEVTVEAAVTRRRDNPSPLLVADGLLRVDGLVIYKMENFSLKLKE